MSKVARNPFISQPVLGAVEEPNDENLFALQQMPFTPDEKTPKIFKARSIEDVLAEEIKRLEEKEFKLKSKQLWVRTACLISMLLAIGGLIGGIVLGAYVAKPYFLGWLVAVSSIISACYFDFKDGDIIWDLSEINFRKKKYEYSIDNNLKCIKVFCKDDRRLVDLIVDLIETNRSKKDSELEFAKFKEKLIKIREESESNEKDLKSLLERLKAYLKEFENKSFIQLFERQEYFDLIKEIDMKNKIKETQNADMERCQKSINSFSEAIERLTIKREKLLEEIKDMSYYV